jgi:hypothetical protein
MGGNGPVIPDCDWSIVINYLYKHNDKELFPSYVYFPNSKRRYYVSPCKVQVSNESIKKIITP